VVSEEHWGLKASSISTFRSPSPELPGPLRREPSRYGRSGPVRGVLCGPAGHLHRAGQGKGVADRLTGPRLCQEDYPNLSGPDKSLRPGERGAPITSLRGATSSKTRGRFGRRARTANLGTKIRGHPPPFDTLQGPQRHREGTPSCSQVAVKM